MTPPSKPQEEPRGASPPEDARAEGSITFTRSSQEPQPEATGNGNGQTLLAGEVPAAEAPVASNTDLRLKGEASPSEQPAQSMPVPASIAQGYVGCTIDGRYLVESIIGEGGMGLVYRARHRFIDKLVAIKILRPEVARHREVTDRFLIEAKAASAVGNAHIVDTLDFGHLGDGSTYFVMEYLEGNTLSRVLESEAPLAIERIVRIAKQIARALACAHDASIVHRDLKPDNVFLIARDQEPDFVKILDFGIAKVGSFQNKLTRAGAVFGTPHYMSPEQASGISVDHRSDIYSLGVMLYEMATGRVPFDAEMPLGILAQHLNDEPAPPSTVMSMQRPIPPGLEAVILKCLAKERSFRYQSMSELGAELEKLETGYAPRALEERTQRKLLAELHAQPAEPPASLAKNAWRIGLTAVAVLGVALGAVALWPRPSPSLLARGAFAPPSSVASGIAPRTAGVEPERAPANHAKARRAVALVLSPIDAHVFRDDHDLGAMPVTIQVAPGEKIALEVRRHGYWPRRLEVDDSLRRVIVRLAPQSGAAPAPSSSAAAPGAVASAPPSTTGVSGTTAAPAAPSVAAPGAIDEPAAPSEAPAPAAPSVESKPALPPAPTAAPPSNDKATPPDNALPVPPPSEPREPANPTP